MVIIKGKMPTKCYDCLTIGLDFENCPLNNSESADVNTWMRCDHRHPDCPIVGEIPDKHGRIIDEKWVELYILKYFPAEFSNEMEKVYKLLKLALKDVPTILEASE